MCKLDHLLVIWWWEDKGERSTTSNNNNSISLSIEENVFIQCSAVSLFSRFLWRSLYVLLSIGSVNVSDKAHQCQKTERISKWKKRKRKEDRIDQKREKKRNNGLMRVVRLDIPWEQAILTLGMSTLNTVHSLLSLSFSVVPLCVDLLCLFLIASHVRRCKLINHRKSITRRDERVSCASER